MFAPFITGIGGVAGIGAVGEQAGQNIGDRPTYEVLRSHYYVWRNLLSEYDYVGFESATRPLLLDPMPTERLRAEFPAVLRLRRAFLNAWSGDTIRTSDAELAEHAAMRAAMTEADHARLTAWLSPLDVVTTPRREGAKDALRLHHCRERWTAFTAAARAVEVFRSIPKDILADTGAWPCSTSCIMRAELFEEFAENLFAVLFALEENAPEAMSRHVPLLAERLLGAFLHYRMLVDPLLRIAEIPQLLRVPAQPPTGLPERFDPAGYLTFNPDVAMTGLEPASHFLAHGWREGRVWMQPCD